MPSRRAFLASLLLAPALHSWAAAYPRRELASLAHRLRPVGRLLELPGYYVWCSSPIYGPDRRVHVFFSRWEAQKGMGGWLNGSEIAHAVASHPEGPYEVLGTVLAPRGPGYWDATTCHNPSIQYVDGQYALFFMGNSNGRTDTKRIGLATAPTLDGPWARPDQPLLLPGPPGAWDDHCTTNPAFVKLPSGQYWLYYKSWNTAEYEAAKGQEVRGNRKYGLAVAERLAGPYQKYAANPVLDFSGQGHNAQFEDAYLWRQHGRLHLLARDMGVYGSDEGLYLDSKDGLHWSFPKISFLPLRDYGVALPPAPKGLKRYGRLERPQLLLQEGRPDYLFCASQGGAGGTASTYLLKVK